MKNKNADVRTIKPRKRNPSKKVTTAFSLTVRRLIEEKGLAREAVADACGVSPTTVTNWCSDSFVRDAEQLCLLADTMGVSVDYLLGRTEFRAENAEARFISDMTGLNDQVVALLIDRKPGMITDEDYLKFVNSFLPSLECLRYVQRICSAKFQLLGALQILEETKQETLGTTLARCAKCDFYEAQESIADFFRAYMENEIQEAQAKVDAALEKIGKGESNGNDQEN